MKPLGSGLPRFRVWKVRWWELEADFRMRLYRSAERNGGQSVFWFWPYKPKGKGRITEKEIERGDLCQ